MSFSQRKKSVSVNRDISSRGMSYQSFGVKGDSDSEGKWKGLQV